MPDTTSANLRMHIAQPAPRSGAKELKVSLPCDIRVKLHSLKLLTGATISHTVQAALEEYFRHHGRELFVSMSEGLQAE